MKYDVLNRYTGVVQFTAEIECDDDDSANIKIGLSARWGLKNKADLAGADLAGADLSRAYLSRADLSRADLSRAYLAGADLSRADLAGAYLAGADLAGADLAGADLSRADLSRAYLSRAYLSRADLAGADLAGADLAGADLAGADLIDGGQDIRGYRFIGHVGKNGFMVLAGCRYFTLDEAFKHWAKSPECLARVKMIEVVAKQRGMVK